MTRAKETADIIHKQLPELPREESDLLREGAPIPPEPPVGHWRPEASVRYCLPVSASDQCLLSLHKPVLTLMRNVPNVHNNKVDENMIDNSHLKNTAMNH